MQTETRLVANWGNFPSTLAEVATPDNFGEARDYLLARDRLLARGNGRCYGDAALGPHLLSTLRLNRLLAFDPENGIVHCEAGLLLRELLRVIVPAGWFLQVTPGIKAITVGGAIASDVHGKNHPNKGCWSNWLLAFELMQADGQIVRCSRSENPDLFWQTCGGMGWTGVVLTARFQLVRISSTRMRQSTFRAADFEQLYRSMAETSSSYAAAWIDTTSGKGRGTAFFAEHLPGNISGSPLLFIEKKPLKIPFFAPSWLLNPVTMRAYNELHFRNNPSGENVVELDSYFYPLDALGAWNRLYGRRGFIQYQFCLPEAVSFDGLNRILETIRRSQETPFLSVLKRHSDRPAEAVHSFPLRGYSLALDFPRTRTVFALVNQLDNIVYQLGGRIYLAKDACSSARVSGIQPGDFGTDKFYSLLKGRLMTTMPPG
ncbi:MAG: FAD-binding oxidoreductase [Saprospiraceae bacterium]